MFDWLQKRKLDTPSKSLEATPSRTRTDLEDASSFMAEGKWEEARDVYIKILERTPDDSAASFGLGDALYQLYKVEEALPFLQRAVKLDPSIAEYHYKLGNAYKDLEQYDEAILCYDHALEVDPRHPRTHNNLGTLLEIRDEPERALDHYRRAFSADATLAPAALNLATLLHRQARYQEAIPAYQSLLAITPEDGFSWLNLGKAYQGLNDPPAAIEAYRKGLAVAPELTELISNLGLALVQIGQLDEAEAIAHRIIDTFPQESVGWLILGNACRGQRRESDALAAYQRGLEIDPNSPILLNNVGTYYTLRNEFDLALPYYEKALSSDPQFALAWLNRGNTLLRAGEMDTCISAYRKTLEIEPGNLNAGRYLLTAILYTQTSPETLFREHLDFGERFIESRPQPRRCISTRGLRTKIRIGYVSSDFRGHPVGYNLQPILAHRDRNHFEVFLYGDISEPDSMTEWYKNTCDGWRSVHGYSDAAIAEMVREDEIDILVILAGRFDSNKPLVASFRPAPVQVSFHDPATSGLWAMDYLIADRHLAPKNTREYFTERVAHLPTFYLHAPLDNAPVIGTLPALENHFVTFGSFNNPAKITDATVALWARVLQAIPKSRLILKYWNTFATPSIQARYLKVFDEFGISPDRVELQGEGHEIRQSHLNSYSEIDIALDPFPFTGSTTSFEALWMGVPVISLMGYNMAARWSGAMLHKVGLAHLATQTEADYIAAAQALASDLEELARLRADLRERVRHSPLCAGKARARQIERLYRWMWAKQPG